jgi:signal transduction histidine kinase/ActR/RegA family two-component response regulator
MSQGPAILPVLARISQIRSLSAGEAQRGYPVHLHGVVTFSEAQYRLLTVQDPTGGVFVDAHELRLDEVRRGWTIDLEGFTGFEGSANIVVKPQIRLSPGSALPEARPMPLESVTHGRADYEWVQVSGQIVAVRRLDNVHIILTLSSGPTSLDALVATESELEVVPGTSAVVRGVPVTLYDTRGRPRATRVHVAGLDDVTLSSAPPVVVMPANPSLPRLTTVRQVKQLPLAEARRGYPVLMRGTANVVLGRGMFLFFEDPTGGIYVRLKSPAPVQVVPGTQVEIEGFSNPGEFAPVVALATARALGAGRRFPALQVTNPAVLDVSFENRWASIRGVVRGITYFENENLTLEMAVAGQQFAVRLLGESNPEALSGWVDAEVAIEGILSPMFDAERHLQAFHLLAYGRRFVRVLQPAPRDPFAVPATSIPELWSFQSLQSPYHRFKTVGVVTLAKPNGTVYLSDGGSGLRIQTGFANPLRVGQRVEALGFLPLQRTDRTLENVVWRSAGSGPSPSPIPATAEEALGGSLDSRLVRLDAHLLDSRISFGDRLLLLQSGNSIFRAYLEEPQPSAFLNELRLGSMVRLTGICAVQWDWQQSPPESRSFRLLLRTPDDVEVIQLASWWTLRHTLIILGLSFAGALLFFAWGVSLRRRVRTQTAVIRAKLEREAHLESQLAQAQKMESIGRLAGGVAHDFNNLLTVINGYSALILQGLRQDDDRRGPVAAILHAGERAADLTQQLLAFGRKQVRQPRPVNLNSLISENELLLGRLLGEDVRVTTRLDPALGLVTADPGQLHQVLLNLAANARDAMPGGGALDLVTRSVDIDAAYALDRAEVTPGAYVMLAAADTGAGMDAETREHIFEPFFTTKGRATGTGLGLSTVYGIVRQNGGFIEVESNPGNGSTFRIYLPSIPGVAVSNDNAAASSPLAARGSATILVVEDSEQVRRLAVDSLRSHGYQVLEADSGETAAQLVTTLQQPIDLLLTDVVMPGMTGRQLAERIRSLLPGVKVLFTSGYSEELVNDRGALDPRVPFLAKPFKPAELIAKVADLLDRQVDPPDRV